MIETRNFDQRPELEILATQSPEHQRVWEDFLIVEHTLPAWKQLVPDVDLVEGVISQLADFQTSNLAQSISREVSSPQKIKPRSAGRWVYASALSVAALLVVVFIQFSTDESKLAPSDSVLVNQSMEPSQPALSAETNNENSNNKLNQLLHNAKAASWGLAQSTAVTMTEAVNLVPVSRSVVDPEDNMSEESNWVDDINKEMQPLKEQIGHAWNFIILSVPEESTNI
ncbi:MAG: hypothetical protein QM501_15090 [Gimesia sp.]